MSEVLGPERKKQIVKEIIRRLHQGLSVAEARDILLKEIGSISSLEIAEIEQALINEGVSPDEIKKFCNVHALLFEATLQQQLKEESPAHPVALFKAENRQIEKLLEEMKNTRDKTVLKELLEKLRGVDIHYTRKEQLLFPYLEKAGFFGPSKVMWGKDNDIRQMLKEARTKIEELPVADFISRYLDPLIEEVRGMIFKEENILFPTAMEKLKTADWIAILKESPQVGYVFIQSPADTEKLITDLRKNLVEEAKFSNGAVEFPSGRLSPEELLNILNTLPVDISFIDKDDKVRYFSETRGRIFLRPRSVIGRDVRNCHPPQSLDKVEKILSDFKGGKKDSVDFWINFKGRFIYIRYFAVRDSLGKYLGTLEVTQDITEIKKLEGEKRLEQ